jgi:hypothetical protein
MELQAIEARESMKMQVNTLDGSKHEVQLQSYTFGKQIEELIAKTYDIVNEGEYGLYVQTTLGQRKCLS